MVLSSVGSDYYNKNSVRFFDDDDVLFLWYG